MISSETMVGLTYGYFSILPSSPAVFQAKNRADSGFQVSDQTIGKPDLICNHRHENTITLWTSVTEFIAERP